MNKSESIVKIAAALVKAQKNIGSATKGAVNPHFKSKFADLGSVMEACKEALNAEGISILQPVLSEESGDYVETILLHESGEFLSSRMKLVLTKQDMQAYGAAVSYARRYGLQSMVFIPAEDNDAESTMNRAPAPAKQEAPKASAPVKDSSPAVTAAKAQATVTPDKTPVAKPSGFKVNTATTPVIAPAPSVTPTVVTKIPAAAKNLTW